MSSPALMLQPKPRPLAARDLDRVVWIDASLRGRTRQAYFARRVAAAARDPERHLQLGVDTDGRLGLHARPGARRRVSDAPSRRCGSRLRRGRRRAGTGPGRGTAQGVRGRGGAARAAAGAHHRALARARAARLLRPPASALAGASSTARSTKPSSARRARRPWSPGQARRCERLRNAAPCGLRAARARRGRDRGAVAGRHRRRGAHRPAPYRPGPPRLSVPHRRRGARRFGAARVASRRASTTRSPAMSWLAWTTATSAAPSCRGDRHDRRRSRCARTRASGARCCRSSTANLAALGVERVETVVEPGDLALTGFFYAAGFRPSERLFVKQL